MAKRIDITGNRYGRLVVESYIGNGRYKCVCDCGNVTTPYAYSLKGGSTKSCGCLNKENLLNGGNNKKHGLSKKGNKLYKMWLNFRRRCTDKNHEHYYRYGGRGISYAKEWSEFTVFKDWAMNNGYEESLEIDRIDNDGDYTPENCKFSTRIEQMRNRYNTLYIKDLDGKSKIFIELCECYNVNYKLAHARYKKGWKFERIFELNIK